MHGAWPSGKVLAHNGIYGDLLIFAYGTDRAHVSAFDPRHLSVYLGRLSKAVHTERAAPSSFPDTVIPLADVLKMAQPVP